MLHVLLCGTVSQAVTDDALPVYCDLLRLAFCLHLLVAYDSVDGNGFRNPTEDVLSHVGAGA